MSGHGRAVSGERRTYLVIALQPPTTTQTEHDICIRVRVRPSNAAPALTVSDKILTELGQFTDLCHIKLHPEMYRMLSKFQVIWTTIHDQTK